MRIAVLGGGNGSFAGAGDLAMQGHDVRLWRRDMAQVAAHRAADSRIAVKDAHGRHDVQLALVTSDMAEAVIGAELILCPSPAFAQHDIARQLAPHLAHGQVVFLPPATFGSMIFATAMRDAGNRAAVSFAETGTLPWLTRKHGPFEVAITIRAKRLPVGVFRALGHSQGRHAASDPPGHRRARCRTHRDAQGFWLWQPAFSAGASLRQRRRAMDVRPRLA